MDGSVDIQHAERLDRRCVQSIGVVVDDDDRYAGEVEQLDAA
jgi:hypothetical protein